MKYTREPHGLQVVNNVNMATLTQLVTQVCWLFGSFSLTIVDCYLLVYQKESALALAIALIGGWTAKTGAGVVDADNKRKASPEYAEVIKAKSQGTVLADVAARKSGMFDALTGEHAALSRKGK